MTTIAFLPPSSSETRFSRRAAATAIARPVSPLPVKLMTLHVRALDERHAHALARAGDHVHDARREAGLVPCSWTSSAAQWGVSLAGLSTTVLPLISAAVIFQHGIAIGKFHGVMIAGDADRLADAHRPLVGQLARGRVAEHAPALPGHQVGDVDAFLDVAARLGQDLAHLARHLAREAFLVLRRAARRTRT